MDFFPDPPRGFFGRRWLHVGLRASHILCMGVLLSGMVFAQPKDMVFPWLVAAVTTGTMIMVIDLHSSFCVLCEVRGFMIASKILLVTLAILFWDYGVFFLIVVVAIGGIGSHAPRRVRHRVLFWHDRLRKSENSKVDLRPTDNATGETDLG